MSIIVRDKDGNRTKIAGMGLPGPAGKSAYQYAVEGGFAGTETEFAALLGTRSNANLLRNWYFGDPVNQRGQEKYPNTGYAIDGWMSDGGVTVGDGFIAIAPSVAMFQKLENQEMFFGSTVTISALTAEGQLVTSGGVLPQTRPASANTNYIPINTDGITIYIRISTETQQGGPYVSLYIGNTGPATTNMLAAKVEFGPVQTLARKEGGTWVLNDPPPDKALELLRCQPYQLVLSGKAYSHHWGTFGTGYMRSSTEAYIFTPMPTPLRSAPAVTWSGALSLFYAGGATSVLGMVVDQMSTAFIRLRVTVEDTGMEPGTGCALFAAEDPDAVMIFDANL